MKPSAVEIAQYVASNLRAENEDGDPESSREYTARFIGHFRKLKIVADIYAIAELERVSGEIYFPPAQPVAAAAAAPRVVVSTGAKKAIAKQEEKNAQIAKQEILLNDAFRKHVFKGVSAGDSHTGFHSIAEIGQTKYAVQQIAKGDHGCYAAWVSFGDKTKASSWKASTFFPDDWNVAKVEKAIKAAFLYSLMHESESAMIAAIGQGEWGGIFSSDDKKISLLIAGRGSNDRTGIITAYPAWRGLVIPKEWVAAK